MISFTKLMIDCEIQADSQHYDLDHSKLRPLCYLGQLSSQNSFILIILYSMLRPLH